MIHELTKADTLETLIQKGLVLVDFYADWCGPCKMQKPVLNAFSEQHPEAVIIKVNVDTFSIEADRYQVLSIPTMFVFKNGKSVYKKPGFHSSSQLLSLLKL
jgi:thioredoxin 1